MGVKYGREYSDIVQDLMSGLHKIEDFYSVLGMDEDSWNTLDKPAQLLCLQTLADDVIFALGNSPKFNIGEGNIKYDEINHLLIINNKGEDVQSIRLIPKPVVN